MPGARIDVAPSTRCIDFEYRTLHTLFRLVLAPCWRMMTGSMGIVHLNAVLGSLVVTVGFWLIWGEIPPALAVVSGLLVAGFLIWQGSTIAAIWAWVTLFLGLESLTWPVVTMVRVRMTATEPTEQEMGLILTALLFGLFSAIFWLTFSYGLFKRMKQKEEEASTGEGQAH